MNTIRQPVVAGYFYPGKERVLKETIHGFETSRRPVEKKKTLGMVLPHAGYDFSGAVAEVTVASCEFQNRLIVFGPKHRYEGEDFSLIAKGSWQTPLGMIAVDEPLAQAILKRSKYLKDDEIAHRMEHCIEVVLPFLQFYKKDLSIVPVLVSYAERPVYRAIARDIVGALEALKIKENVTLVASSDMTHYESHDVAFEKDHYALEAVCRMDAETFLDRIEERNITMCGAIAVYILMHMVKALGATNAELIKYQTSGETTGDKASVVGYAGVRFS